VRSDILRMRSSDLTARNLALAIGCVNERTPYETEIRGKVLSCALRIALRILPGGDKSPPVVLT
jgi:hypothetical protein